MLTVVEALTTARVCPCDCHNSLSLEERVAGIKAVYALDDALRGWGFQPIYDVHGDRLFKEAQMRNDDRYRGVAVRFGECIYRRLVGSMLHECIHAMCGDVTKTNYGVLFCLPYAVPASISEKDEAEFLEDFNFGEARAWLGVWILGSRMFGLDWGLRTARDIGTYCFTGGNALQPPIPGYRAVAYIDRQHHPERYYARGRKLEERARAWFDDPQNLESMVTRLQEASAIGLKKRPRKYPEPEVIAKLAPKNIGRNEACVCGSAKKFKDCCAINGTLGQWMPSISR